MVTHSSLSGGRVCGRHGFRCGVASQKRTIEQHRLPEIRSVAEKSTQHTAYIFVSSKVNHMLQGMLGGNVR